MNAERYFALQQILKSGKYEITLEPKISIVSKHNWYRRLKLNPGPDGYVTVTLSAGPYKFTGGLHELVTAICFGPAVIGKVVNHKDGNRANNHPSNLECVTVSENMKHSWRPGNRKPVRTAKKKAPDDPTRPKKFKSDINLERERRLAELRMISEMFEAMARESQERAARLKTRYGL